MGFCLGAPGIAPHRLAFPKIAALHRLVRLGLPVPPGSVVEGPDDDDPRLIESIREQLEVGRVIARSASAQEDSERESGAGLGSSIAGIRDEAELANALASLWRGGAERVLVQREIPRSWLLVIAGEAGAADAEFDPRVHAEVHGAAAGTHPLASGRTPDFSGPLDAWDDPARRSVLDLVASLRARDARLADASAFPHGFDAELVVDSSRVWLVQLRPLVASLLPGWPRFRALVAKRGETIPTTGTLILDGEHNPKPLSPAHAWLMAWLAAARPSIAGDPLVLAGWLYVRALPRDLDDRDGSAGDDDEAGDPRRLVETLATRHLPQARRRLDEVRASLAADGSRCGIQRALEASKRHFLAMIDLYVGTLAPARRRFRAPGTARPAQPLSLSGRESFLDVLPAQWDLASPSLSELLGPTCAPHPETAALPSIPDDPATAATLLGEWDDHLFALGLAPLREVWLAAGRTLGLAATEVFLIDGDELHRLLAGDSLPLDLGDRLERRARELAECACLHPPLCLRDGRPELSARRRLLGGFPIGETFAGPVASRTDLEDLIARPPPPGSILCLPTLTAQAAVALARLRIQAVCTEHGGALAHGALMARELGLSALIGCSGCTRLSEGTPARLDTAVARLFVLEVEVRPNEP